MVQVTSIHFSSSRVMSQEWLSPCFDSAGVAASTNENSSA
jgi:hypothetical protein